MKKMKKTISIILAVIMLVSAVPLHSFAIFDWFYPTIEKVEFADNIPVSNKNVQIEAYDDKTAPIPLYGMDGNYNYSFRVYLSNGEVIESADFFCDEETLIKNGIAYVVCTPYVEPDKCAEAIAEGKSTIDVELSVMVQYLDFRSTFRHHYFSTQKELVPEIVKEVRLTDTMPESYDKLEPHASFVGKKFEVEYGDGRKETYILEDQGDYNYYLGGEPIGLWYGEDSYIDETTGESVYYEGLQVYYIDAVSVLEKKLIPCPYENFEVLGCKFNGKGQLSGLTYRITYKDGNTLEKTLTFEHGIVADEYAVIDTVDGNNVEVYFSTSDYTYWIDVYLGHDVWDMYENVEGSAKDVCDCICHKESTLEIIFSMLLCRIWKIFRIREYCQCGYWHW